MLLFLIISSLTAALAFLEYDMPTQLSTDVYQSQCAHRALENVIEECASGGVESLSPELRKQLAVLLSVCEFQDAAVEFPDSCKQLYLKADYHHCVQDLRKSSQLWTTYLGNYRKIKSICHEEAMPFFKEHLVDLFNNVTREYTAFYEASKENSQQTEQYQEQIRLQFDTLLHYMMDSIRRSKHDSVEWQTDMDTFREEMTGILNSVQQKTQETLEEIVSPLDSLKNMADSQLALVSSHRAQEADILSQAEMQWSDFKETLFKDMFNIAHTIEGLQESLEKSDSKQLVLHESLDTDVQLSTNLHHRLRAMESDLEQYLELQTSMFQEMLLDSVGKLNVAFNESINQVAESHAALRDSIFTIGGLVDTQKENLREVFSTMNLQANKITEELRSRSFFNLIDLLSKGFAMMLLSCFGGVILIAKLSSTTLSSKLYEFGKSVFTGIFLALIFRLLWKLQ